MAKYAEALSVASEVCTEWRVHHELPNRTRYKLACPAPRGTAARAIERAVEALSGVLRAEFTVETGSLLVQHDGAETTRRGLRRALATLRFDTLACAPGDIDTCAGRRDDVMKDAVLSLLTAALPPAPRAALKLVQSLRASAR